MLTGLDSVTILPWRYDHRSRTAAVSRPERTGHAGPSSGDRCSRPLSYWLLNPTAGRTVEKVCSIQSFEKEIWKKAHYMDLMYLHSVVWESNGQEVTGRTSVAVLHHAQAARFDLQQHVWCFHIKHLRQWQRERQSDPNLSGHKDARKRRRKKGRSTLCSEKYPPEQHFWLRIWCASRQQSRCCTWPEPPHHFLQADLSRWSSSTR